MIFFFFVISFFYTDEFLFCSFTDGLTEITNEKDEEFGDVEIHNVVDKNRHLQPEELNKSIIDAMNKFKGSNSFKDDITLLSCRVANTER